MNTNLGLIATKLGNTQVFDDEGMVTRVTALRAGPCVVVGKRTLAKDGYTALQLGFGEAKPKRVRKAQEAVFTKLEIAPARVVREFRVSEEIAASYEVGQTLKASDVFEAGQFVDVSGVSKGRGFTGVIKRHGFKGSKSDTHGTHEYRRHGGSIGMNMTPGRTLPNQKMAGQYGNVKSTVLNLRVAKVLDKEGIVLVAGAVPGAARGTVMIRGAVKKRSSAPAS